MTDNYNLNRSLFVFCCHRVNYSLQTTLYEKMINTKVRCVERIKTFARKFLRLTVQCFKNPKSEPYFSSLDWKGKTRGKKKAHAKICSLILLLTFSPLVWWSTKRNSVDSWFRCIFSIFVISIACFSMYRKRSITWRVQLKPYFVTKGNSIVAFTYFFLVGLREILNLEKDLRGSKMIASLKVIERSLTEEGLN